MKLQALPQQLPYCLAPSPGLCKEVKEEMGRKRRFLEQLPWRGSPSAALGSLWMGSATDSKNGRAESEPKPRGQVSFALQGLDKASFISGKRWDEACPPLMGPGRAKAAGFARLGFGQLPLAAPLKHGGRGRTAVIGALLKMERL